MNQSNLPVYLTVFKHDLRNHKTKSEGLSYTDENGIPLLHVYLTLQDAEAFIVHHFPNSNHLVILEVPMEAITGQLEPSDDGADLFNEHIVKGAVIAPEYLTKQVKYKPGLLLNAA